jgi:hypothetical protein
MTAEIHSAGAAPRDEEGWYSIDWEAAHRIVCRLQARIVKAIHRGLSVGKPRPGRGV